MSEGMFSVEQVADLLDLHVRTVRGYIRTGRLPAVKIGKQYRIARADLDAFTGRPVPDPPAASRLEVTSVVQIDAVDRGAADRLTTLVTAAAHTGPDPTRPLRVQTIHDPERHRLKIVLVGDADTTADLLRLLHAVLTADNDLLTERNDSA